MMFPPLVIRLRIAERGQKKIRLCIPLFLLWPLILAVAILFAPLVLIIALVMWKGGEGKAFMLLGPRLFAVFCATRGLKVHIENPNEQVYISVW
jgi:hypothetical protein